MKEFAPSKINLFLDVLRKRDDGYHDLGTVFQTVDAGDYVWAERRDDGVITLEYSVPQDYPKESDLVYKAAKSLREYALELGEVKENGLGADLYLEKVMPLGAGLGGGSADAAATLRLLNKLWNLGLNAETLEEIGAKLGADVPFLVRGGTAFAEGIGEKLTFIPPLQLNESDFLLICTPLDSVPTKDAYAGVALSGESRWENYKKSWKGGVPEQMFNGFEQSVFPKHPLVAQMKEDFLRLGAKMALMSGSGASVFGIFEGKVRAEAAAEALKPTSRYQIITKFFATPFDF